MNHTYAALAASALSMGGIVLAAPAASAMLRTPGPGVTPSAVTSQSPGWPDEGSGYPGSEKRSPEYNYPEYKLDPPAASNLQPARTSVWDNSIGAVEAGASALGGAGVALGGLWLVRRRSALAR
ncbi:hypothetical protein EV646_101997 [Kribbella antiqua]|uniref:MYXO-CTERM domain-containing protein n=1 Tax=Kribbella antiqua TaxID=2512217 RepID=A0A4R2J1A0_9ACTN|nr:hypothetical protein [Kribbella antiqua]TCO52001.1 hypothetical protein EV646_101997 [Kribbella antiqua]